MVYAYDTWLKQYLFHSSEITIIVILHMSTVSTAMNVTAGDVCMTQGNGL